MNVRERFQSVMNFKPFDRLPLLEWCHWWDKTVERWVNDGDLPATLTERYALCDHFGLDMYKQGWFGAMGTVPYPEVHGQGVIQSQADYERLRPQMYPDPASAVDETMWRQWAAQQARGEAVLWFTLEGAFWWPRTLFGIEPHMYAFYDHKDLMHQVIDDLATWELGVLDKILTHCTPDFMSFAEDLSYNHGPMLSKDLFDEFIAPFYRRMVPVLKKHGILAVVDSDGDIRLPTSWFEEVGVDGMLPLERQSGVDVAQLRRDHPKMRFIGCFDKMTMTKGEAAMRAEFERLLPTARQGGLILSCDHQTPPGVSYAQYQSYLKLFREYAQKAATQA